MKMRYDILLRFPLVLGILLLLFPGGAMASHIVGGQVVYKFLGAAAGGYKYQVSLTIYEDCLEEDIRKGVLLADDPAHITVFDGAIPYKTFRADSVHYTISDSVPVNFSNSCVTNPPHLCLLKKTFDIIYTLPPNTAGYVVSYQRCCRNASVMNIKDPGHTGSTYFCTIPAYPVSNTSAVFKNYPPQIICMNNPLHYDHGATDADGDSLSYTFCEAYEGSRNPDNDAPDPPPYNTVQWNEPAYTFSRPMSGFPPIQINPVTGEITGTPNKKGRFLVTVCCYEWRDGQMINVIKREFQFVVTDCSKAVVANIPQYSTDANTYIVNCVDYNVHFVNGSKGGSTYLWDFGVPHIGSDVSAGFEPNFTYPDTGTFTVKLVVNPGSTCQDSISRLVKIYPKFSSAFADSGKQCIGAPVFFKDQTTSTIKPITSWKWDFGDGQSSDLQNPEHTYEHGGLYHVIFASQNARFCADTAVRHVTIENFSPFGGDDTTIVKGEKINFQASGGNVFTWSPSLYLSDTTINNPTGYYPDTGQFSYVLHVNSAFGCSGNDTIVVTVVNQAEFFMPSGFTPNGDGMNDVFRPVAVGYSSIKYFKIFNRWGQQVYNDNSFETGWDGSYNHKQAEMGVYFWEIFFTDRYGRESFLKGDVTLVR